MRSLGLEDQSSLCLDPVGMSFGPSSRLLSPKGEMATRNGQCSIGFWCFYGARARGKSAGHKVLHLACGLSKE